MVNSSMYDLYYTWHKQVPPGARPNFIIMGSATVSDVGGGAYFLSICQSFQSTM